MATDLEQLLSTERVNDARIQRARSEAAALVAAARGAARDRALALSRELDELRERYRAEFAAECDRRSAEIATAAAAEVARIDAVTDSDIEAIVPAVIERLIAGRSA